MSVAKYQSWEIAHIGLCVNDVSEASDYYATIVGLISSSVDGFSNGTQGAFTVPPESKFRQRARPYS